MTMHTTKRQSQRGFLLIEGMVAILVFSLGVVVMLGMAGTAIGAQSDARYRTDAARLADDISNTIALGVDRTSATTIATTLAAFQHQPTGASGSCSFSGTASTDARVTTWVSEVMTTGPGLPGLPGAVSSGEQIAIDTTATGFNKVTVTVCWKEPGTAAAVTGMRHHTVVTFVN